MRIYLAGGMEGLTFEEQNDWRADIKNALENIDSKVIVVNPVDHFCELEYIKGYESEREVMEFDLYKLKKSDLVIVNYNNPNSRGTMAEIAIAYDNKIPVIGLNENNNQLHSWQHCMSNRIFQDKEDLILYVIKHYTND